MFSLTPSLTRYFLLLNKTSPLSLRYSSNVIKKISQRFKKTIAKWAAKCCVNKLFQDKNLAHPWNERNATLKFQSCLFILMLLSLILWRAKFNPLFAISLFKACIPQKARKLMEQNCFVWLLMLYINGKKGNIKASNISCKIISPRETLQCIS